MGGDDCRRLTTHAIVRERVDVPEQGVQVHVWMGKMVSFGNVTILPTRTRRSDILNIDERLFINLGDVTVNDGQEHAPSLSINTHRIDTISEL